MACDYPVVRLRLLHFNGVPSVVMHHRVIDNTLYRQDMLICNCIRYSVRRPHGLHIPMPYSKRGCLSIFYAVARLWTATSYILTNVQRVPLASNTPNGFLLKLVAEYIIAHTFLTDN